MVKNEQHWNITWAFKYCWCCVKENQKILRQKRKDITEEEKQKYKTFFKGEEGVFIIEKVTHDVIERCKLPKVSEIRKKLGYNHDNIMVGQEISIAEKTTKMYSKENVMLNIKFNNRKPDIWFKDLNFIVEVD